MLLILTSHPVIIPNWALPLNYIPLRSCLTKVIHHLVHPLFSVSNSVPGLSLIYLGQAQEGMVELQDATNQKATDEHGVIDEAIRDRGEGYTVFSIVSLYRVFGLRRLLTDSDSLSGYSTGHQRTSSRMPRLVTFWEKL